MALSCKAFLLKRRRKKNYKKNTHIVLGLSSVSTLEQRPASRDGVDMCMSMQTLCLYTFPFEQTVEEPSNVGNASMAKTLKSYLTVSLLLSSHLTAENFLEGAAGRGDASKLNQVEASKDNLHHVTWQVAPAHGDKRFVSPAHT
jgi:hypothetical protein